MSQKNSTPAAPWDDLASLCRKIHDWWHVRNKRPSAKRLLPRLKACLRDVPENDSAIVREEALALLNDLQGDVQAAIKHRRKEIRLVEMLHESVEKSVQAGDYDRKMARSILAGCDEAYLEERRAILRDLEGQSASTGHTTPRRRVS